MKQKYLYSGLFVIGVAIVSCFGCKSDTSSSDSYTPGTAPPNTILMATPYFSPSALTITHGTTVTWTNNDNTTHTSTSNTGIWDTGDINPGSSKKVTFNNPGSFPFYCAYHRTMGMTGTITVK